MSETKFTPGPWAVCRGEENHVGHVVVTAPGMPAHSPLAHIPDWDEPEATADAALIAAAPCLYSALEQEHALTLKAQEIVARFHAKELTPLQFDHEITGLFTGSYVNTVTLAALAKARGEANG